MHAMAAIVITILAPYFYHTCAGASAVKQILNDCSSYEKLLILG